jgi:hypothetical protein
MEGRRIGLAEEWPMLLQEYPKMQRLSREQTKMGCPLEK